MTAPVDVIAECYALGALERQRRTGRPHVATVVSVEGVHLVEVRPTADVARELRARGAFKAAAAVLASPPSGGLWVLLLDAEAVRLMVVRTDVPPAERAAS